MINFTGKLTQGQIDSRDRANADTRARFASLASLARRPRVAATPSPALSAEESEALFDELLAEERAAAA